MDPFGLSTEALYFLFAAIAAIRKASGTTIRSGTTGLLYTLGRVSRRSPLEPGFHLLIPFVQRVRRLPTRSRTLDLPAQRVATHEGYVFTADANLVYRVTDVEKALVEVKDLVAAMRRMLTLGVQDVLRAATFEEIKSRAGLDDALRANLEEQLEPWGVTVERIGFQSISPSPRTVRITQLRETVQERTRQLGALLGSQAGTEESARPVEAEPSAPTLPGGLGVLGTRRVFRTKARARRVRARRHRSTLRLRSALEKRGYGGAEIDRVLDRYGRRD